MKYFIKLSQVLILFLICCPFISGKETKSTLTMFNSIQGQVFDPYRAPISDIYVELQNELGSTISRIRTTTGGRYIFSGISSGHFNITVRTLGTNYLEQTQSVDIVNVIQGGSDAPYVDFYLQFDKRKVNVGISTINEAVFVQEIPDAAHKLYKSGFKNISSKDPLKGLEEIEQALKIFPDYFDALNILGREYTRHKEYQKAIPYLIKAIDINQRSFSSYYSLAYCALQLNHIPEAVTGARAATVLQPDSVNAQLLYGTTLRSSGSYDKALEALLKAKTLIKDMQVADIHWQLALVYNKLDRNKEAADELDIFLKLMPDANNKKEIQELSAKLRNSK